jgi:diguanylate cyclase (GGDEF)-like protein
VLNRTRELQLRLRSGELIPVELKAVDLGVEDGARYFGAILVDLRSRKAIEAQNAALLAQLEVLALTDELTELPNRRASEAEMSKLISYADREGWPITLGFLDIDRFKQINDTYGHAVGDTVLREVAKVVHNALRVGDVLGRWGGEEFCLLLPKATISQSKIIAERCLLSLSEWPIDIGTRKLHITASIGLEAHKPGTSLSVLLAQADAALYEAKEAGRNRVVIAR